MKLDLNELDGRKDAEIFTFRYPNEEPIDADETAENFAYEIGYYTRLAELGLIAGIQ